MNITSVNSTNPNFNGKVITKGSWPRYIDEYFRSMPKVAEAAKNSEYNIIGKMHRKLTYDQPYNSPIMRYKLEISVEKENPNIWERIKNFLGLNPRVKLTNHHHREERYPRILDEMITSDVLINRLGIR